MIEHQLRARDIYDPEVLRAMSDIDRTMFVPDELKPQAYKDAPLPIGKEQTISQPYIVAYMAQALELEPEQKVLEVGTGCGYNAAVLSRMVKEVYSIEVIEWLADLARKNLKKAGITNVQTKFSDGFSGWPEYAPFDAIILTAAPPKIPDPLKKQLKIGGKLLAPVGTNRQNLVLVYREEEAFERHNLHPVSFVPMTGQAQK